MKPEQKRDRRAARRPLKFSKMRRILASVAVGVVASIMLGVLVFVLAPKTNFVRAYLAPGIVIGGSLSRFIPTRLTYWLVPEGGPDAFLMVATACASIFWSLVFAISYRYAFQKRGGAL